MTKIVSLDHARKNGLKKYFTGIPCSRGDISERRTSDKRCVGPECSKWQSIKNEKKRLKKKEIEITPEEVLQALAKKREYQIKWTAENQEKKREYQRLSRIRNPERHKAYSKKYYDANKEMHSEKHAIYHIANRDRLISRAKAYAKSHPESVAAANHKLRAKRIKRVPCWYSELDDFVAKEAILLCRDRFISTGVEWHVDHMIPMNAKKASGLHVWNSIQVIPAFLNLHKQNKMIMTEPMEWIGHLDAVIE